MAENLTLSLPGQKALSGGSDALFMKTFTGEVMTAFEERNVMKDLHRVRTIDHGKSASFALLARRPPATTPPAPPSSAATR